MRGLGIVVAATVAWGCAGAGTRPAGAPSDETSRETRAAEAGDTPETGKVPAGAGPAGAFSCTPRPDGERVRVEMRVDTRFEGVDASGTEVPGSSIGGMEASYVFRLGTGASGQRRAEVFLEGALPGHGMGAPKNAWAIAVQKGWIAAGRPFAIEQGASGWCWAPASGCDTSDAERNAFVASIGQNVDLVHLPADTASSLHGKTAAAGLETRVPTVIAARLGLKDGLQTARAEGPGFPARFVATETKQVKTERRSTAPDGTEVKEPQNNFLSLEASFVVDGRCRLLEVRRVDTSFTPFFEGKYPSGARIRRTLEWRFTPIGS